MATRVAAVRTLAGLLLGAAVLAGLVLLARTAGAPRGVPTAPGAAATGARSPAATLGGQATTTSGPGASAAAGTSPTAPPSPGPASDPCRLVTRAEAAAVLGRPVAKVQPRHGFLVRSCLFSSAREGGRQVIVQLHQGPAASRAQFRMGRRADDQPVAGVGDDAWFTPDTGLLDVRKGAARFQVGLLDVTGRSGSRRVPPGLVSLARAATARLEAATMATRR
jgi:hypothetical protein